MGISLSMIEKMQNIGLFGKGHIAVLDVGSSNLYEANPDGIKRFLESNGVTPSPEILEFAERLAKGSTYDAVHGGINEAFVGELFEKAGIKYDAIDIADGYRTTILDLNHSPAPPKFVGAFDLVLNFGTTEHLLNQYNAFKVIHDATKVGGYIVHSLPGTGYSNHGYFTYTPRCFFDIAGYNEYEVVSFWFEGPSGKNDLYAPVRDYLSYFPSLSRTLTEREQTENGRKVAALDLPDVGIVIVYRKVKARPFTGALERSTSVGNVPTSVTSGYDSEAKKSEKTPITHQASNDTQTLLSSLGLFTRRLLSGKNSTNKSEGISAGANALPRHDEITLPEEAQKLREQFVSRQLNMEECLRFYDLIVQSCGYFPYDWEESILLLCLEREPNRSDLNNRLAAVRELLANKH